MSSVREKAEQIADDLRGTPGSLHAALENHGWEGLDNDQEFCDILDSLVFECEKCGWWCEISEMTDRSDNWICEDCDDDD